MAVPSQAAPAFDRRAEGKQHKGRGGVVYEKDRGEDAEVVVDLFECCLSGRDGCGDDEFGLEGRGGSGCGVHGAV